MKQILAVALCFTLFPLTSQSGWFGASDYDECILESMKGVTSNLAAKLIRKSCKDKFPPKAKKKPRTSALSYDELSKLTGRAGLSYGNYYSGTIYNGNKDITIAEISFRVTTTIGGVKTSRIYTDDVNISPQTTADIGFNIVKGDKDADYSWGITGANGY